MNLTEAKSLFASEFPEAVPYLKYPKQDRASATAKGMWLGFKRALQKTGKLVVEEP